MREVSSSAGARVGRCVPGYRQNPSDGVGPTRAQPESMSLFEPAEHRRVSGPRPQ
jgi:hypothetical protein